MSARFRVTRREVLGPAADDEMSLRALDGLSTVEWLYLAQWQERTGEKPIIGFGLITYLERRRWIESKIMINPDTNLHQKQFRRIYVRYHNGYKGSQ